MSKNVSITDLPSEVIGLIVDYTDISIDDVINLSMTCNKLYYIINNEQTIFKRKCFQRWTWMQQVYEDYVDSDDAVVCWKKVGEDSLTSINKLQDLIDESYNKILDDIGRSELTFIYDFFNGLNHIIASDNGLSPLIFELIKKEFTHILFSKISHELNNCNGDRGSLHLIRTKYHRACLKHMNEIYFTNKWVKLLDLPAEKQSLSKFGILAHEWLEHNNYGFKRITSKTFNSLAKNTMINLHKTCPEHPIFSVSKEKLNFWRDNVIEDNQWNYIDGRNIAEALRITMLESDAVVRKSGFGAKFLTKNLEFSVILESTGRRLGLRCGCAIYSDRVFLKLKECCDDDSKTEDVYLDFIRGGEFLKETNCPINGTTIGNCKIIDDQYLEKMQKDMSSLNELINVLMTSNPNAANVKKYMEIYETMQASYDKRSYLEVTKLNMQAAIICRSLEKLYVQKRDSSIDLVYYKIHTVLRYFSNFEFKRKHGDYIIINICA